MTFIVDSVKIRAHRCVLAAISPKYKAQLYATELDKDNIKVDGITAAAFDEFLRFFYFDKIDLTFANIGAVLDLAKQSLVKDFEEMCVYFLTQTIAVDNVCTIYRLAILHDIEELIELCVQKISKNTNEMFATDDFVQCDRNVLSHILNLESFCCRESDVFDACIAWARAACERKSIDAEKSENLRAELRDLIYQVRFASMTLKEFVKRQKSLAGLFTPNEFEEIIYIISKIWFKSDSFIQTPRERCSNLVACDFECNRVLSYRENNGVLSTAFYRPIDFTCSCNFYLVGFALISAWTIKDSNEFVIAQPRLMFGGETQPKYTQKQTAAQEEIIIIFEKPILIESADVTIKFPRIPKDTFKMKFELINEIEAGGIQFTFSGEFPITRLFGSKR